MNRPLWVALAWAALLALVAAVAPAFFDPVNLRDLVVRASPLLIVACGMTIVILARQIDISVGSQFAICGVVAGLLAREGLPMPLVALGTMGAGAGLGLINGLLVARLGLPAIVVTLATLVAWREGLRFATEGVWVQDLPAGFQWFGLGQDIGRWLVGLAAAAVWAAVAFVLGWTPAGRAVYATGSDAEVARLLGVRPPVVIAGAFVVMGALTGLAALLSAVQFIDVQANAGIGLELSVIAAVVVGGTAVSGGRGSLTGTLAGVALLATVGPALTFLGAPVAWERALQGAIILIAVSAEGFSRVRGLEGAPCPLTPRRRPRRQRRRHARRGRALATPEIVLLALLIGELVWFSLAGTNFLTLDNGLEILRASAEVGLLALALTPVILTGGIDLSCGALLGLSAVVFGAILRDAGLPLPVAVAAALGVGLLGGAINAWMVAGFGRPALIVTLGTASLFRGLAEGLTGGAVNYSGFPAAFLHLGQGRVLGLPTQAWVLVAAVAVIAVLVHAATIGRALRAIGYAPEGARFAGIPVGRRLALVYLLSGGAAGVAGLVYAARLGQARADAGTGFELSAITAVVLGGTSIFGGRGSVWGTMLGLVALGVLANGLRLADQPAELAGVLTGILLVVAIGVGARRGRV